MAAMTDRRATPGRMTKMPEIVFDVRFEWSMDDQAYAVAFLRDGKPWYLDGALVGMGPSRADALTDLCGIARNLVMEGTNYLMGGRVLTMADRHWLFRLLDTGDSDDKMYRALRDAGGWV